ncbi:hypothetical protein Hanom_Chr16g01466161 [Helianthus anomalus]
MVRAVVSMEVKEVDKGIRSTRQRVKTRMKTSLGMMQLLSRFRSSVRMMFCLLSVFGLKGVCGIDCHFDSLSNYQLSPFHFMFLCLH